MGIKKMMNDKVEEWGIKVLLVSSSTSIRCKCFNPINSQGLSNCNICLGTGMITSIRFIEAIHDVGDSVTRQQEKLSPFGTNDNTVVQFYTKSDLILNQRDKIIVVGIENGEPRDVKDVYVINMSNPLRMVNGRIEGNVCTATKINAEKMIYQRFINRLNKQALNILKDGGRYICPQ